MEGRNFQMIKEDLARSLLATKTPADLAITLIYCIPIFAPIRVCIEVGIFVQLAHAGRTLSAEELARSCTDNGNGGAPDKGERRDFVVRMLRAACAVGLVDEPSTFAYQANDMTRIMADPGYAAGFQLLFDNSMGPRSTMAEMVSYHRVNGWKAPPSADDGPWQRARDSAGTSTFDSWVQHDPTQLTRLSALMQRMQRDRPHWTQWFPEQVLFGEVTVRDLPEASFLVDVGGGRGHDISALAARWSDRKVGLVLQDLPSVIEEGETERSAKGVTLDSRIELSKHDFFQTQPVRGADVYYLHKIFHDWPDKDCVQILTHLRDAMAANSRIMINDLILPDRDCPLLHAVFDVDMLALHSGKERDEEMWQRLVRQVGNLEIIKFWHPPDGEGEGIIEIRRSNLSFDPARCNQTMRARWHHLQTIESHDTILTPNTRAHGSDPFSGDRDILAAQAKSISSEEIRQGLLTSGPSPRH